MVISNDHRLVSGSSTSTGSFGRGLLMRLFIGNNLTYASIGLGSNHIQLLSQGGTINGAWNWYLQNSTILEHQLP